MATRSVLAPARARGPRARPHPGSDASPELPGRELWLLALGAALLAVVVFWPLPLHLGDHVPKDIGDPLPQAWQVAWGGHALLHQPLDYFQSNQFWPRPDTLAYSDALVGYAPAGLLGSGPAAAIARYDLLFLFAYALAFAGAYLLARELGCGTAGAAVAGAAYAFAPWRLEQNGHLHVLSSGGIPLALFLLLRGYRGGRPGLVFAGWLVVTWQVSLGFSLGLQFFYLLAVLAAAAAIAWWRRGRSAPDPAVVRATIAGVIVFAFVTVLLVRPYLRVLDAEPQATRTTTQVAYYSGPLTMFLAAPSENLVWGKVTAAVRDDLRVVPEQTLFPGLAVLVLALAGLAAGRAYPRGLRIGLALGVVALAWLSLGFPRGGSPLLHPYRIVYDLVPGATAIRVPERLMTLTTLGLALLAGAGVQRAADALRGRGRHAAAAATAVALVGLVVVEGAGWSVGGRTLLAAADLPRVPSEPAGQRGLPAPQLHLPLRPEDNRAYLLWSTAGFPDLLNGRSSVTPRFAQALETWAQPFPDRATVARLRGLGVRTVIVHRDRAAGSPWAAWARRPVRGLALTREVRRDIVRYHLR